MFRTATPTTVQRAADRRRAGGLADLRSEGPPLNHSRASTQISPSVRFQNFLSEGPPLTPTGATTFSGSQV